MARHLSRVMTLSHRPGAARTALGTVPDVPQESREASLQLPEPLLDGAALAGGSKGGLNGGSSLQRGGDAAGQEAPGQGNKQGAGAEQEELRGGWLVGGSAAQAPANNADAERRQRAQAKLQKLMDSVRQLETDAYEERQRDANAGGCWWRGPSGVGGAGLGMARHGTAEGHPQRAA